MFDTDEGARQLVVLTHNTGHLGFDRTEITVNEVMFLRVVCQSPEKRTFMLMTNSERVIFWLVECNDAKQTADVRFYLQHPTARAYPYTAVRGMH